MQTLAPVRHYPLPQLHARQIALEDHATLTFVPHVPVEAALRRAAVHGSTLYAFVGTRIDVAPPDHGPYLGGYVGKSDALAGRAGTS